jgi:hypothetical protein
VRQCLSSGLPVLPDSPKGCNNLVRESKEFEVLQVSRDPEVDAPDLPVSAGTVVRLHTAKRSHSPHVEAAEVKRAHRAREVRHDSEAAAERSTQQQEPKYYMLNDATIVHFLLLLSFKHQVSLAVHVRHVHPVVINLPQVCGRGGHVR